jgi:peptide/nickel transport system substrate-binding protein
MKNRKVLAGLVTLFTVLTAFAALPVMPAKAAADQPNVLYIAMQQDLPDFNTWNLASNSVWKSNVINWGFESLVSLDYDMLPYGVLAQDWSFDEASLTWTFHLRQGVTFQDGSPFTADDVVFIYTHARENTVYSSNIINAFDWDQNGAVNATEIARSVVKVDDYTVNMTMAVPYGQFLSVTAGIPILPKAIWQDHLVDDLLDVLWNDPKAAISTGPWMYKEGAQNTYRIMVKYPGYWGKNQTTPLGYKMYPPNVDELYYKIYASIDTAILALQSGAVDYIAWPVTAGRVPSLQADPNVRTTFLSDNGYFYLAFNEKFDPMGNVSFRRAVSMLIDKDQIVNVYMGGYGTKGSAVEPPFWGDWYNSSVDAWPYSPDNAKAMLTAAGFIDVNGDGWRDLPGGAPMPKITILTPPADYDPIRIRAGQMIAKNMRDAGINAEAKAIDFDTLVTRLNSMDYQMLIIGWSLGSEPVTNVFDIMGPKAPSNTFGFWSVDDPNPFYKDLFGVNTLADAATQAAANEVTRLGALARQSFNVSDQIKYTKWAEGVLASYIPVNVLYYRVNIYATRNTWTGWLPYLGDLFGPGANLFSLSNLQRTGAGGGAAAGATASVNAGLSMPGKGLVGETEPAYVNVIDNVGNPVSGATITVTVEGVGVAATVTADPASGTTGSDGVFKFNLTGTGVGYSYVNITASKGGVTSNQSSSISIVDPLPLSLAMTATVDTMVLNPSDTTDVTTTVVDQDGNPVEGVNVTIDPNLVSYGSVDKNYGLTDSDGVVTWTYDAPDAATVAKYLNSHLTVTLSFAATKSGYPWSASAASNLLIFNAAAPDWVMAQVVTATTATNSAANTTSITVAATDDAGNLLLGHTMNVTYSDESLVFNPVTHVTTDLSGPTAGQATFTVQFKDMADSTALRVKISNDTVLNSVGAYVTLTYKGTATPVPTMYGGYMTWDLPAQYMDPIGAITATAHVWDQDGAAATGINASLVVTGTSYGSLAWCDLINWDSTYDGLGINIATTEDKANIVTSGPFNTYFDYDSWEANYDNWVYWDWGTMDGIPITAGTLAIAVYGVDVAPVDLIGSIYLVPGGMGFFNDTSYAYQIGGNTTIGGDYVVGRSYQVAVPNMAITNPVMVARDVGVDSTKVVVSVQDENGDPLPDANTKVYQNSLRGNLDYMVIPYGSSAWSSATVPTGSAGTATSTIIPIGNGNVVTQASMTADVYASAAKTGYISMFAQNIVTIHVLPAFITLDPVYNVQMIGDKMMVTATVTDSSGDPVPGLPVELTVSGGATVAQPTLASDADGIAAFEIDTSGISNSRAAFVPIQAKTAGIGYGVALATMMVPVMNSGPTLAMLSPKGGSEVVRTNVSLLATASDMNGIQTVKYSLDGGDMITLSGTAGATVWDLSAALGELSAGSHTLALNATDTLGITSQISVTFTAVKEKTKSDALAWGVAIVGWIIAALLVVMMLMRRPKAPEEAMAPEPAKPEEEEVSKP